MNNHVVLVGEGGGGGGGGRGAGLGHNRPEIVGLPWNPEHSTAHCNLTLGYCRLFAV